MSWRASQLVAKGREARAIRLARIYARLRPGDPESWKLLGEALLGAREYALAEEAMMAASAKHPGNPEINYPRAQALVRLSRLEEAGKVLQEQRAIPPNSFLPLLGLVDVYWEESDDKALATAIETAGRIPPDYPWGKYELAVKLLHIAGGESLAHQLLEEASRRLPENESRYGLSHLLLAVFLERTDPPVAKRHLEIAQRSWRSSVPFDEILEGARRTIGDSMQT